jgi:hypothetical protein
VSLVLAFGAPAHGAAGGAPPVTADSVPSSTINEFIPEERPIGDCISALPKPGCGSEERGGWHQYAVLIAVLLGLAVIAWRIVVGLRRKPA